MVTTLEEIQNDVALEFCKGNTYVHSFNDMIEYHADKNPYWWKAIHSEIAKRYGEKMYTQGVKDALNT